MHTDRNNFSPRLGFAYRLEQRTRPSLRGGFGIFHPTGAAQGARDIMSRNPFRYTITHNRPTLAARLHHWHCQHVAQDFGNQGLDLHLQSPTSTSTTSRSSASCPATSALRVSYIGSTMRKLLVTMT